MNDIYAISNTEIDRKVTNCHSLYQLPNETSRNYYTRFEAKYSELIDLGKELHDEEIGLMIFKGLSPMNKRLLHPFMSTHNLNCTLTNMSKLCKYADEMDEDPNPNKIVGTTSAIPLQANLVSNEPNRDDQRSVYGTVNNRIDALRGIDNRNYQGNGNYRNRNYPRGGRNNHHQRNLPYNDNYNMRDTNNPGNSNYMNTNYRPIRSDHHPSNRNSIYEPSSNPVRNVSQHYVHPDRINNIHNNANAPHSNIIVPTPGNTTPGLTYQIKMDGTHNWFMHGKEIIVPSVVPDFESNHINQYNKRPRSNNSNDNNEGNTSHKRRNGTPLIANFVDEVTDNICSFDYSTNFSDFLDYYLIESLSFEDKLSNTFPDYLGAYYDMLEDEGLLNPNDNWCFNNYETDYHETNMFTPMSNVVQCYTLITNTIEADVDNNSQVSIQSNALSAQQEATSILSEITNITNVSNNNIPLAQDELAILKEFYELVASRRKDEAEAVAGSQIVVGVEEASTTKVTSDIEQSNKEIESNDNDNLTANLVITCSSNIVSDIANTSATTAPTLDTISEPCEILLNKPCNSNSAQYETTTTTNFTSRDNTINADCTILDVPLKSNKKVVKRNLGLASNYILCQTT